MNEEELIYTYEELEDLVLKYQELYIKEKNNNNKAIEYIESYMPNYDFDKTNLIKVLKILRGVDKE